MFGSGAAGFTRESLGSAGRSSARWSPAYGLGRRHPRRDRARDPADPAVVVDSCRSPRSRSEDRFAGATNPQQFSFVRDPADRKFAAAADSVHGRWSPRMLVCCVRVDRWRPGVEAERIRSQSVGLHSFNKQSRQRCVTDDLEILNWSPLEQGQ
jgi:hypothetical protein